MTSGKKQAPRVVKVFALALPALTLLALGEWGAGIYLKHRYGNDFDLSTQATGELVSSGYQLWEHPTNYWNWQRISRYNNLGFRRFEDTSIEKPPGTIRVFILGGSGALGASANRSFPWLRMSGQAQYSADETISSYLEARLNEKYPGRRFEVINGATNWAQLHQQLIHYYRKIRYLEPDLIISMDGQNDAWAISDQYLSWWDQASVEKMRVLNANLRVKLRPLIARSHLLYLVAALAIAEKDSGRQPIDQDLVDQYKLLGKPADYEQRISDYQIANREQLARGVAFYAEHLQHFYDALNRDGVKALFIQQPELVEDRTKRLTEIESALQNYLFLHEDPYAISFFRLIEQAGNDLRVEEGLPFHSFLNILGDAQGEVYVDYTHLTPHGNALIATRLVELIETEHPDLLTAEAVALDTITR